MLSSQVLTSSTCLLIVLSSYPSCDNTDNWQHDGPMYLCLYLHFLVRAGFSFPNQIILLHTFIWNCLRLTRNYHSCLWLWMNQISFPTEANSVRKGINDNIRQHQVEPINKTVEFQNYDHSIFKRHSVTSQMTTFMIMHACFWFLPKIMKDDFHMHVKTTIIEKMWHSKVTSNNYGNFKMFYTINRYIFAYILCSKSVFWCHFYIPTLSSSVCHYLVAALTFTFVYTLIRCLL